MITSVVQYSTIDFRFLKTNLEQLSKFSDEIIVVVCDHFFNGELEDENLLKESFEVIRNTSNCIGYIFEWEGEKDNPGYYHNLSRCIGTEKSRGDWLLFVDGDEIVDDSFREWFTGVEHTDNTFWLTCYWYFRDPIYRATSLESAGLLIRRDKCNWNVNIRAERQQLFAVDGFINGDHQPILHNGTPLVHHYSWVREEAEMLKKVYNWGHKGDKDWTTLVRDEFSRPFNGSDFVHGYRYVEVPNQFNLV